MKKVDCKHLLFIDGYFVDVTGQAWVMLSCTNCYEVCVEPVLPVLKTLHHEI